jgi:hypothetical protein
MARVLTWIVGGVGVVVAALVGLVWVSGLGEVAYPEKVVAGDLRTDVEPLISRWPVLGDPVEVSWMGGTLGESRAPGPSTFWIDAVLALEPELTDTWVATYPLVPAHDPPDLVEGVAGHQPSGPLLRADELDAAFSGDGWWTRVYLAPEDRRLVLVAVRAP